MGEKSKSKKGKFKNQLRDEILRLFQTKSKALFNYKQVASQLKINDQEGRKFVFSILVELAHAGQLKEVERGKFKGVNLRKRIEGVLEVTRKGHGYVVSEEMREDVFVDRKFLGHALHGDKVVVELFKRSGSTQEGRVVEVLDRKERRIIGVLQIDKKFAFLVPDDPRIDVDIFIPLNKVKDAVNGTLAIARITDWPETAKSPFGEIIETLGLPDSNEAEMKAILVANGIRYTFPQVVIDEAMQISVALDDAEIAKRRDFRNILTMTIDPVDAKDFDDALSIEFLSGGNIRVGVHIADVAHYIPEKSQLDKEALARGNSVYLVDRVVPMLPEHLSNVVCSLRPEEEKFTFSAVFELDKNADVVNEWFGKTVICSDKRFTYEDAQEIIESGKGEYQKELLALNNLAVTLRKRRMAHGALEVHSSEIRFELNEAGVPVNVYKKTSKEANKLVEEFMLLANKQVAAFVGDTRRKESIPLIYRVHDFPDREKLEQFSVFVSKFGLSFKIGREKDIARDMNVLFEKMKNEPEFGIVQQMAIKSMAKAVYDTENIGHFGLAFRYYAHFTSPIRRYADLMVHRILFDTLEKKTKNYKGLQETARHISITERKAVEAERASQKYFQAQYLRNDIGKTYTGVITGLTDWGIYVEMRENYCEGMISLKSLTWDNFYFDEKNYRTVGSRTGDQFNLGDTVEVELVRVNMARRQIDLELVQ